MRYIYCFSSYSRLNSNRIVSQDEKLTLFYIFRLIRPVGNSTDRLTVKMGLKLSQIIGVDMKRQILITNVWLEQVRPILDENIDTS